MNSDKADGAKPTPVQRLFNEHPITAVPFEGGFVVVVAELEAALKLKPFLASKQLSRWEGEGHVREGVHHVKLTNGRLAAFKSTAGDYFTNREVVDARTRHLLVLTERGLYRFLQLSRSPVAVAFQDWLEEEVLPSIRRTGGYQLAGAPPRPPPRPPALPGPDGGGGGRKRGPPAPVRVLRAMLERMRSRMEAAAYEALDVALAEVEAMPDPFEGLDAIEPDQDIPDDDPGPGRTLLQMSFVAHTQMLRNADYSRLIKWCQTRPVRGPTPPSTGLSRAPAKRTPDQ